MFYLWDIELLFKLMKTFLHLRKVEQTNYYRAMISIYSSLIALILLIGITMTIHDQEISLYKACKIFIKHIEWFFEYPDDQKIRLIFRLREKICQFAGKEARKK